LIAVPCIIVLSIIFIYLFFSEPGRNESVNYLAIAITAVIIVLLLSLVAGNLISRKTTEKIIKALENIGQKNENFSRYDELMQFAINTEQQRQAYITKIDELSNRVDTIETITESMEEGLILIDSDGLIISANNSASLIFGESIVKRNVAHIGRDDDFQDAVRQCLEGNNAEARMERDNRIYTVFFSPVYYSDHTDSDDNIQSAAHTGGAVILFHDATESHRAEKQRHEFSANVSHELKTPLTTISALSEMIAQGIARENDIKNFAGRITEQSGRLLVLIDDIIRLSEFDEGKADRDATVFDLWELAETVINSLRDNTGSIEIELTGERFDITANNRMIDELLFNLIDNGVKYNKENGKVTVDLTKDINGHCRISVSDTGIGIGDEHHQHIFERFYRVEKSRSKKTGGTGLGLSIVKHITEYYNGSVEIKSAEGSGTTITCCLML